MSKRLNALNIGILQSKPTPVSPLLRVTLIVVVLLQLGGAGIGLSAASEFAAGGLWAEQAQAILLTAVFLASVVFVGALIVRPRYMPVALVMLVNAISGVTAFMLLAANRIEPVGSAPLVALTGVVLLALAAIQYLELRKVHI